MHEQDRSTPTPARQRQLLEIWRDEVHPDPEYNASDVRDPHQYTAWDDVLEDDDPIMTYDEWKWCGDNFEVKVQVTVTACESR